jgi:amino acid adenylation domain-containing protein
VIKLLQEWVAESAAKRPDSIAVTCSTRTMTYRELEAESNRLANLLRDGGAGRGDRVGVLVPKTCQGIVAMLGAYKADCIAVPLEPTGPAPRLVKVLESAEPTWILAVDKTGDVLDDTLAASAGLRKQARVGTLSSTPLRGRSYTSSFSGADLAAASPDVPSYRNSGSDTAHLLFTSGSTGMPKGVQITHDNVRHFVDWGVRYFGIDETDRVSGLSPLQFDLSTFDIFGAFAAGAELHLVPPELPLIPHELAEFMRAHQLTQWFSVPTVLNYMARFDVVQRGDFPALRRLMWCGEVLPTTSLIYWMERLPHVQFTNLYGPTETTVASSYHTVAECPRDEQAPIPIGTACAGEELAVLDSELRPVPRGQVGEICIKGSGLSPGYWRDPEKTRAAFPRDPSSVDPAARLYRTGDLGRVGVDGLVYFLGRADSQVKSRGYRIELGEVEAALHAIDGVRECAVSALETGGFEGAVLCCAYASTPGSELEPAAVRRELQKVLPGYMLPMRWKCMPRLPRNSNGKIDRKALREEFETDAGTHRDARADRAGGEVAVGG